MTFPLTWDKGLNVDALPSELAMGFASNGSGIRTRNGFTERVGGLGTIATLGNNNGTWLAIYPSTYALGPFGTLSGAYMVSAADDIYADDLSGTSTDITPYTPGAVIVSITRSGTTATVTTATPHSLSVGNLVQLYGNTPTNYSGNYTVGTTPTITTFTYTVAGSPVTPATVAGYYAIRTAITMQSGNIQNDKPPSYSGGILNGTLLVNGPIDGLFYWNGDTATRLRKVPDSLRARVSRPFKNFIFQLATSAANDSGVTPTNPYRVAWSAAAEPGAIPTTFTAAEGNLAGLIDLAETGGEVIDCLPMNDVNVIYKSDSRWAAQYLEGSNQVFAFTRLPGDDGLLWINCVVDTPVGHVFLNQNMEVMVHNGGECKNLSRGRVQSLLSYVNDRATVTKNPQTSEVWIVLQGVSSTRILIWNWAEDTWGIKDYTVANALFGAYGSFGNLYRTDGLYFHVGTALSKAESDDTDMGTAFDSYVERQGIDGGDPDTVKNLQRSRWNWDAEPNATMQIQHGSAMTADAAPTYASAATHTQGTTDWVNSRATGGKYLAIKATWTSTSTTNGGRVRTTALDITAGGKR